MSNDAPQIDPKYKRPIDSNDTDLIRPARSAFRALLWVGILLLVIGGFVAIIGATTSDYEYEAKLSAYSFAGSTTLYAVIFLAASGVVAGLGKRETHDTAAS